ncbi:protein tyrosine phosphatase [Sodalis sp. RH24]|uniref:arsenate reductase/protein-tyrosine-phosphatase family protein n=1 Tax=unclassified Sodalis (in: enterobacteria) TaxID=2636512 RepID=UPI003965B8FB
MFDNILVVCVGNICRSPTGEQLLKKYTTSKKVTSAGIQALVGHSADKTAEIIASENGLCLSGHHARQLTPSMCRGHDLILVMEKNHYHAVCSIAPEVRGKIMLYGHWIGKRDIPDPYRMSEAVFRSVYQLLDSSAQKWAQHLIAN